MRLQNVSSDDATDNEGSGESALDLGVDQDDRVGQEGPNDDLATPAKDPHVEKDLLNGRCVRTPLRPTQYTHEEKTQHR